MKVYQYATVHGVIDVITERLNIRFEREPISLISCVEEALLK